MTRIIIDGVEDTDDLTNAVTAVLKAFADTSRFDSDEEIFTKSTCDCDECRVLNQPDEPAPAPAEVEQAPLLGYIACPRRSTHIRLTDCWACWCDVYRGAAVETDVLAPEAWDIGIRELLGVADPTTAGRHRADVPVVTERSDYPGRHRADCPHEEPEALPGGSRAEEAA